MTEAVKLVTFLNTVFVVLLIASGSLGGYLGDIVYYLAFIIPIAIGFYSSGRLRIKREEIKGVAEEPETILGFDRSRLLRLLPLIAPAVLVVFLASLLSSLLLSLLGVASAPVEDTGIVRMLLVHALVPAFFEEALFRYIPMKLLMPYSKRWCILYSALCFALIHCSFVQMPYAFIAGLIFMLIDVALGSVWPSVILHLVNNTASVLWMKYCSGVGTSVVFVLLLVLLALISMLFVFRSKREYSKMLYGAFDKGESFGVSYAPIALVVICSYVAALSAFS